MRGLTRRRLRGLLTGAAVGSAVGAGGLALAWWWILSGGFPLVPVVESSAGRFTLAAAIPIARSEAGGTACGGRFYVVGGIGALAQTFASFVAYDPRTDAWHTLPDLPQPLNHPGVACAGGKVYVAGGFGPLGIRPHGFMFARWNPTDAVWIFDPTAPAGRWTPGPKLPAPRGAGGVAATDGAIWYVGGIDAGLGVSAEVFRLDLQHGTWDRKTPMTVPRDHLRLEAVGDRLFAIAGRPDDLRFNLSVTERYDVVSDTWSRVADIPTARSGLASAVLDGFIYTFGGEHVWTSSDGFERYDPERDAWESLGALPEARHGICAGVVDGRIHLVSGGRHPRLSISAIHRVYTLAPRPRVRRAAVGAGEGES
jgi:Kelch motif protein